MHSFVNNKILHYRFQIRMGCSETEEVVCWKPWEGVDNKHWGSSEYISTVGQDC